MDRRKPPQNNEYRWNNLSDLGDFFDPETRATPPSLPPTRTESKTIDLRIFSSSRFERQTPWIATATEQGIMKFEIRAEVLLPGRFHLQISERVHTMHRVMLLGVLGLGLLWAEDASAQVYQAYYAPATVYYQPAPAAVTTYYAPTPQTVYYAPAPTVSYYAPPAVATTYYRPLLGGAITRTRYVYAPVTYSYPTTVTYYPAW